MVDGGLASQVFKYAFGEWLARTAGWRVHYDLSWFATHGQDGRRIESRRFELEEAFPAAVMPRASGLMMSTIGRLRYTSNRHPHVPFDPASVEPPVYLGGYYAHARYFEDNAELLRGRLRFAGAARELPGAAEWAARIAACRSPIAMHVRRGDFVGSVHDVVTPRYFADAITTLLASEATAVDGALFVFTNDASYVTEAILPLIDRRLAVHVVAGSASTGIRDLYLMNSCRHFVISNSGYSWLAAWLRSDRAGRVFMPARWFAAESDLSLNSEHAFWYPGVTQIAC